LTPQSDSTPRTQDALFRDPGAPVYWQASRLWLVVALARAAHEAPAAVAPYAAFLVRAGCDDAFPHLLLRAFARDAARALAAAGAASGAAPAVDARDLAALDVALGAGRRRAGRDVNSEPMDRDERGAARRYQFDSTDTVPYWFRPAVRAFADLDMDTFLARPRAGSWTLGASRGRYGSGRASRGRTGWDRWEEYSHSHGARPLVERYSTHLEWHAMWCAAGSLLATHALTRGAQWPDEDPDDTLGRWVARAGLHTPPYWLADLREPAPPGKRSLPAAHRANTWLQDVDEADLRDAAGLAAGSTWITVAADDALDGWGGHVETSVHTALVSPGTAVALVRALQSVDDAHCFRLPDAGDDYEIRAPHHRLVGWISRRGPERGDLDDYDPMRRGAAGLVPDLPTSVTTLLGIRFALDPFPRWADVQTGATVLRYRTWSSADERGARYRNTEPSSRGWRLQIAAEALQTLLAARRLDLVMEVGVHRRSRGYAQSAHDTLDDSQATEDDARFSRVYLLHADGRLASADGPLGAWAPPRPELGLRHQRTRSGGGSRTTSLGGSTRPSTRPRSAIGRGRGVMWHDWRRSSGRTAPRCRVARTRSPRFASC
jgi:hypothetical protein